MRLYLIRHGRTPSNVNHLLDTAFPGADLDDEGRAQAAALASELGGEPIEALYASDLVRTQQTMQPLADRLGLPVTVLGGLREIQAGEHELSPVWEPYVAVLRSWAMGNLDAVVPGGERVHEFFARYDGAVSTIADGGHGAAALVSHGAALRTWIAGRVRGLRPGDAGVRVLGNTAVVTVEGDPGSGWDLVDWRDGVQLW